MVAACEGFFDRFEMTFLRLLAVGGIGGGSLAWLMSGEALIGVA